MWTARWQGLLRQSDLLGNHDRAKRKLVCLPAQDIARLVDVTFRDTRAPHEPRKVWYPPWMLRR